MKIRITAGTVILEAELADTLCSRTVAEQLPIVTRPNVWGDEFYFTISVDMPLDDTATRSVKVGDIGYWPPGNALAIFFGPTPMSTGPDPVPASEVNLVGRVVGDATALRKAKGAREIRLEQAHAV
jgi:uncharacterized protein